MKEVRRVNVGMVVIALVRLLMAVLLCVALPVVGQVPESGALNRAQQQVDDGDFEDAIKTVDAGIEESDLTDDQLAEMYRLLGLSNLYLGHEEQARDAFEKLLQARPDYELPKSAPPKIVTLYARIKDDIRKRRVRPVTLSLAALTEAPGDTAVRVEATIDDLALGARAKLFYRRAGAQNFNSVDFTRVKGNRSAFGATVPAFEVPAEEQSYEVEYYVEVADAAQRRLAGRGDRYQPLTFRIAAKKQVGVAQAAPVPLYKSPWLWVGIGVAAAAAATGVLLYATSNQTATLPVKIQIEGQP
jgi:tetratricopeptide (TPR) repeat protein